MRRSTPVAVALAALTFTSLAVAHDDDPKILARQPATPGPGLKVGVPPTLSVPNGSSYSSMMFQSQGVTLLSWTTLSQMGMSAGADCWGYVSPSGREYAIMTGDTGSYFVEISVPNNPQLISFKSGPNSTWRDVKIYKDHAYVVTETSGAAVQIFDLSNIDGGVVGGPTVLPSGGTTSRTHNVVIDEASGYLYRAGGSSHGLRFYDLNVSLTNPPSVGAWDTKYVHDAEVITYTSGPAAGKQIAYCAGGFGGGWTNTGMTVVDVTNKTNPTIISEVFWSNAEYAHQCWASDDGQYLYINDELDEKNLGIPTTTRVANIADPANSFLVGSFNNGNPAIDHNLYVKGNLMYAANYRSGLRVFDRSNPASPTEVRWFDTYPANDAADFNGLWSCYPFFPSGVVIGSDRENGLFVWWVGDPLLTFSYPGGQPTTFNAAGENVPVKITVAAGANIKPGTETLHWNSGGGWQQVALISQGNGDYAAPFPTVACGGNLDWYVAAETTNNLVWADPSDAPGSFHSASGACPPPPSVYCVAKTNSLGCVPKMATSGAPSIGAGSGFSLSASNVRNNKAGTLFYGVSGRLFSPFQGGTLCVATPIRRTPAINAGGNPGGNDCSGVFTMDFNAFVSGALGGSPMPALSVPGTVVRAQYWGRDQGFPAPQNTTLSDAAEFTMAP